MTEAVHQVAPVQGVKLIVCMQMEPYVPAGLALSYLVRVGKPLITPQLRLASLQLAARIESSGCEISEK